MITGKYTGAITKVEQELNRPMNRHICGIHINELFLRHEGDHLLGSTSSPTSFSSEIGKQLETLKNPVIAKFPPIPNADFPRISPEILHTLSKDQKLLYRSGIAVVEGICPPDLVNRALGPLNHARWVTFALRILFLFMTYQKAPFALQRLAEFVIKVYAPMWFSFRVKWRATEAPALFFKLAKLLLQLPEDEKTVALKVFERGAYWLHPENLFPAMLADQDPAVRLEAVDSIMGLRHPVCDPSLPSTSTGKKGGRPRKNKSSVRTFELPTLIWDAPAYHKMVDLKNSQVTEPPLLMKMSDDEIKAFVQEPFVLDVPNNTQFVERLVQTCSKIGTRAATTEMRDGLTRATLKNRAALPRCETRKDFLKI